MKTSNLKRVTFTHNGFHGRSTITIMASTDSGAVRVSPRVAKRLAAITCGMRDCRCGETPVEDGFRVFIPVSGEMRGNYPQGG